MAGESSNPWRKWHYRVSTFLGQAYKTYGLAFPLVAAHRQITCWKRRTIGPRTFDLAGRTYRYLHHPYMFNSERTVEVGLVRDFLAGRAGEILEVGHVLSNFLFFPHDIVDKYEVAPAVRNEDIISFSPGKQYDWIVSVSTLEHVGWDEAPRQPEKILQAFARLKELLKPGGRLVVTMPLGYNEYLDGLVQQQRLGFDEVYYLKRLNRHNQWRQAELEEVRDAAYGKPFPCANAVVVCFHPKAPCQ